MAPRGRVLEAWEPRKCCHGRDGGAGALRPRGGAAAETALAAAWARASPPLPPLRPPCSSSRRTAQRNAAQATMSDKKAINPVWAAAKPFVNGGASGMLSTCLIQPIDMVKVRIQLGEKGNPVSGWGQRGAAAAGRCGPGKLTERWCRGDRHRRRPTPCSAPPDARRAGRDRAAHDCQPGRGVAVQGPVGGPAAPGHLHHRAPGHLQQHLRVRGLERAWRGRACGRGPCSDGGSAMAAGGRRSPSPAAHPRHPTALTHIHTPPRPLCAGTPRRPTTTSRCRCGRRPCAA